MKQFKSFAYLALIAVFLISCEKEALTELGTLNIKPKPLFENLEVGYGFENLKPIDSKRSINNLNKTISETEGYTFYFNAEVFNETNCDIFAIEGFEEIIPFSEFGARFSGPLNSSTNNAYFTPGSIVPGLEFSAKTNIGNTTNLAVFNSYSWFYHPSKVLTSNSYQSSMIISIKHNYVTSVGMELVTHISGSDSNVQIDIYDEYGLASSSYANASYGNGEFWGVKSENPIKQIVLIPLEPDYYSSSVGVDNISYGACGDDYDNDGVLNENDSYPTSNTKKTMSIGENSLTVKNLFTKGGGATMMDELESLIASINAEYNGDNYRALHSKFTKELAKLSYYWYKDRLITSRERSAISRAAYSADVPMFYEI